MFIMRLGSSFETTVFTFITLVAILALIFLVFRVIPEFGTSIVVPVDCSGVSPPPANYLPVHSKTVAQCLFPGFLLELDWSSTSFTHSQPVYSPINEVSRLISASAGTIVLEYSSGLRRIQLSPVTGICKDIADKLVERSEELAKGYPPETLTEIEIPARAVIGIIPRETGINHVQVTAFEFTAEKKVELIDGEPVTTLGDNRWIKQNPAAALGMTDLEGEIDLSRFEVRDRFCSKKDFGNLN